MGFPVLRLRSFPRLDASGMWVPAAQGGGHTR